jgi:hypothetical protein
MMTLILERPTTLPQPLTARELDLIRLREDFPAYVKTWRTMNIAEREALAARTARN